MRITRGLALLGQDVETSAVARYQLQFQLDGMLFGFLFLSSTLNHFWASLVGRRFSNIPTTPGPVRYAPLMKESLQYLIKNISDIDTLDICSDWNWLLKDNYQLFIVSAVGDMFLLAASGEVYLLDTSVGQISKIAENNKEFESLLENEPDNLDNWFLKTLVDQMILKDRQLSKNEVYSFKIPPSFGGEYSIDNLELTDISVHFSITGQIHRQIKDLPEGTKINKVNFQK